jgi:phosphatidylinositol phospholipase C beta
MHPSVNFYFYSRKNTNHDLPDTINTETLINFLNDKQRDPRLNEILYPHYDSKRVMEIINTYEKNPENVAKGLISIDGLTNYLVSLRNAFMLIFGNT